MEILITIYVGICISITVLLRVIISVILQNKKSNMTLDVTDNVELTNYISGLSIHHKTKFIYNLVYIQQFFRSGGFNFVLCLWHVFRLRYECEAYCAQIRFLNFVESQQQLYCYVEKYLETKYYSNGMYPAQIKRCLRKYIATAHLSRN